MLACLLMLSIAQAQSLYEQRARVLGQERAEYAHALYQQRTADMVQWIEAKLNRAAAPYSGATNFAYQCKPGVSGTTFLTCGVTFQTVRGDLGCMIKNFGYDFISCKGPDFTRCADFDLTAVCLDGRKQGVYLRSPRTKNTLN